MDHKLLIGLIVLIGAITLATIWWTPARSGPPVPLPPVTSTPTAVVVWTPTAALTPTALPEDVLAEDDG